MSRHSGTAEISHSRLSNGMELVVIPDHRAPVVTHMVWYRNGAADDPPGKSGIAHFLEHLMFKGTKTHPKGSFSKAVTELGGNENAFTSSDFTAYFQSIAREHLPTMMAFEADRMSGLILDEAEVNSERDVVHEERRQRVDSEPQAQLGEALLKGLFTHHPYGNPIIGWEHELVTLDRADALAYYQRFYTPENAILVVAGDVAAGEVKAMAEKTYGAIPPRNAAVERRRVQEPDPRAERLVRFADPRVEQPLLQRLYLVPSAVTAEPGETEALDLAAHLLGANVTGHLYRDLVVERGLAVAVGAGYNDTSLDRSYFALWAVPKPDVSLADLDAAMERALQGFLATDVAEKDLARAKTRLIANDIYARDSQARMAQMYGAVLASGGSIDDVAQKPTRIDAVSAAQIREVATKWLIKARSATGYLESAPAGAAS
jgi:zinc protease